MGRKASGLLILVLAVLTPPGSPAAEPTDGSGEPLERVEAFARAFLDGRHTENLEGMTPEMRAAFGPEPAEALRSGLIGQNGAVLRVGKAWSEDTVQGYRRYRVPLEFERAELDFRVVLDGADRIAGLFFVPHAEPPSDAAEESLPGKQIELAVGAGETGLPATLTLPAGPGPFAAVVLVHGSGAHDRDESIGPNRPFRDLARGLAAHGIATLRYDKRSYARPADLIAAGETLTVEAEVIEDARAAVRLLATRKEIDSKRIYVVGHSLGGTLVPRIGAGSPRPAGLVSLAGSTLPLPEKMLAQMRHIAALDGALSAQEKASLEEIESTVRSLRAALDGEQPAPDGPILGAPFAYYRDLEEHDPPAEAAALGLPILVLQGKRDYQVTLEDFARWEKALSGKPFACLVAYDGLDHLFRDGSGPSGPQDYDRAGPVDSRVIDDLAAWIQDGRCPGR